MTAAVRRVRGWLSANRLQLVAAGLSALFVLVSLEVAIRVMGTTDEDGNFTIAGRRLQPYRLPVKRVSAAVETYTSSPRTMIAYDPELGWTPRPEARNDESVHNVAGLRVEAPGVAFAETPSPGRRRIALFGDSFVYGSEVPYAETWAFGTARALETRGEAVEVLNFGVPGYGADQAYLRWRQTGAGYAPQLVIFGLQLENMNRHVNLVRPFYIPSVDLPFSKPRFVERQGELRVINQPAVPPGELPGLIQRFDSWELHRDEAFYAPDRYEPKAWTYSRLLAFAVPTLLQRLGARPRDDELTPDKQELTFRLLSQFARHVEARGARFLVLHLPTRLDLQALDSTGELPLRAFLERVSGRFDFVDPAADLVARAREITMQALFRPGGHYTADGNAVVARRVADHLTRRSP